MSPVDSCRKGDLASCRPLRIKDVRAEETSILTSWHTPESLQSHLAGSFCTLRHDLRFSVAYLRAVEQF